MSVSTENISGRCGSVSESHLRMKKRFEYIKGSYENITEYPVILKGSREEAAGRLVYTAGSCVHVKENSVNASG